jgi:plastocyanin
MPVRALLLAPLLIAAVALSACGSSGSKSTSTAPLGQTHNVSTAQTSTGPSASSTSGVAAGGTVKVSMKSLAFVPKAINVKVGDTVDFTNDDTPPHNVTYVSGPKFTSSGTLNTGDKFTIKITQPGTIHYYCSIHPFMKGTILVTK